MSSRSDYTHLPLAEEGLDGDDTILMMSSSSSPLSRQGALFAEEPAFDPALGRLARTDLGGGAWIDHLPEWVRGHESVLDVLWTTTRWEAHRRRMYERIVDVPRLVASLPDDGPGHPLIRGLAAALSAYYGRPVDRVSLAAYRDGRDSVAFHGDRLGAARNDAIVAIVGLGARRRFLLRPAGGGRSRAFDLGGGDLLVMGGNCQRTWEHGVPKVAYADLRISVQFRSAPTAPYPASRNGGVE
jgi:alkylated DNA repair dioxygenase AlkB